MTRLSVSTYFLANIVRLTILSEILEEREAKITAQEAEKAKLMKEVAALQARLVSAPASGAASAEPEEPSGAGQRQDATSMSTLSSISGFLTDPTIHRGLGARAAQKCRAPEAS
jgi:hypothetical protein